MYEYHRDINSITVAGITTNILHALKELNLNAQYLVVKKTAKQIWDRTQERDSTRGTTAEVLMGRTKEGDAIYLTFAFDFALPGNETIFTALNVWQFMTV